MTSLVLVLYWGLFIGAVFLWAVYVGASVNDISTKQRVTLVGLKLLLQQRLICPQIKTFNERHVLFEKINESLEKSGRRVEDAIPPLLVALDQAIEALQLEEEVQQIKLLGVKLTYNLLVGILSLAISVGFAGLANYVGFS